MIRFLLSLTAFLVLAVLQTSLFASLPGWLAYTPLVFAAGVYLVQHVGERAGAYWIAGFGLFLDALAIPSFPFETISYAAAAATAYVSARQVFSNRSWYGLVACGACSVVALAGARGLLLAGLSLKHPERVSWDAFASTLLWDAVLMTALVSVLFGFARHIRSVLRVGINPGRRRDTL